MLSTWCTLSLLLLCTACMWAFVLFKTDYNSRLFQHDNGYPSAFKAAKPMKWYSVGLSVFASVTGANILVIPMETGFISGWTGVTAYAFANACPFLIMVLCGSSVYAVAGNNVINFSDFVLARYGRPMHMITTALSGFFMWIFLVAELTTLILLIDRLSPTFPSPVGVCIIFMASVLYSLSRGLESSVLVEQLLALIIILVSLILIPYLYFWTLTPVRAAPPLEDVWLGTSIPAVVVLIISVAFNELLDMGPWQRCLSCESPHSVRKAFALSAVLIGGCVFLFGFLGVTTRVKMIDQPVAPQELLFHLVKDGSPVLCGVIMCFGIVLVTSTIDSLQIGLASLFAADFSEHGLSLNWSRVVSFGLCVPGILVACLRLRILRLFIISNILATALVPPAILGLLFFPTPRGAVAGFCSGFATIFVCGAMFTKTLSDIPLWITFPDGPFAISTAATFVAVPIVSTVVTVIGSIIDTRVAGEQCRGLQEYLNISVGQKQLDDELRELLEETHAIENAGGIDVRGEGWSFQAK